ncbi:MAG: serine/threonine protein kinase [Myxococcales bacterium]|nr:serine/threonine protein kinase [Myxococcales bacterium]
MASGSAAWVPAAGELVAERFKLERELARGGMGSVWRADHVRLGCPVAVKFIDAKGADSEFLRERFQREARAAARLRSRHVVQILDTGVYNGLPYFAMELLEGESLADRLDARYRLPPGEALDLLSGVAEALTKAARLGIVHRDLKPENLFIVREGDHEFVKVLDFGVAKVRDSDMLDSQGHTKTGVVVGTPYYMSPEQADGTQRVDHRSDLWSLAVIVYECLTGELPFYSEAFGNLVLKICNGRIPVPSAQNPDLPESFDAWWLRAASREPEQRFQTPEAFMQSLREALAGMPGVAARAPLASRPTADDLGWSGPHSSSVPVDSQPPSSRASASPQSIHDRQSTFTGHTATDPGVVDRSAARHRLAAVGALAAAAGLLVAVWSTEPSPQTVHVGSMRAPTIEAPPPAEPPPAPEASASAVSKAAPPTTPVGAVPPSPMPPAPTPAPGPLLTPPTPAPASPPPASPPPPTSGPRFPSGI